MIQTIGFSQFCDAFSESREGTFSYNGKRALFDYLREYEEGTGANVELDTIALCCEYTEYANAYEAMEQYQPEDMPTEGEEGDDLDEIQEKNEVEALNWLNDRTQVIEFSGGIIIQDF